MKLGYSTRIEKREYSFNLPIINHIFLPLLFSMNFVIWSHDVSWICLGKLVLKISGRCDHS